MSNKTLVGVEHAWTNLILNQLNTCRKECYWNTTAPYHVHPRPKNCTHIETAPAPNAFKGNDFVLQMHRAGPTQKHREIDDSISAAKLVFTNYRNRKDSITSALHPKDKKKKPKKPHYQRAALKATICSKGRTAPLGLQSIYSREHRDSWLVTPYTGLMLQKGVVISQSHNYQMLKMKNDTE